MTSERIYILGSGAIGMALAVHLIQAGREVTAVRTSTDEVEAQPVDVTLHMVPGRTFSMPVEMVSLSRLSQLAGVIVVASKAYANQAIAAKLGTMEVSAPVVVLQNGVGVEEPYLGLDGVNVYRCVLYATSQKNQDNSFTFAPVTASPIGIIRGDEKELKAIVGLLNTVEFPFRAHAQVQQEVWKKAIINSVFNSICPLLEVDNGIFVQDERAMRLAREVVSECIAVPQSMGMEVSAEGVMEQLLAISQRSSGQFISTWQDIHHGRETEISSLNLEIARIAESLTPPIQVKVTKALGEMVLLKSRLQMKAL